MGTPEWCIHMTEMETHPYDPARVLARAYLVGLAALRDLLRERVTKNIEDVFGRTQNLWTQAQERWHQSKKRNAPDFSHITEVERHLRRNFLSMIWETTARYGNVESKRVKSEREGRIGPMNRLLNMAGAQLRNFAVTMFPFPKPDWLDGTTGYAGDAPFPWVQVAHTTLPELDFIDMIRAHVFELCRKCFISNVPMTEARRYVNLLIWRLSPFLEYLHTSAESGRWGFKRQRHGNTETRNQNADEVLREIVQEIEALYGTREGRPRSVTEHLSQRGDKLGLSLFLDESAKLRESDDVYLRRWGHCLRSLCEEEILCDRDATWLQDEAIRRARWYGIRMHRILTMGLPQPYNLRSVFLNGDNLAEEGSQTLVVAEVPVDTHLGDGRVDIIVLRRHTLIRPGAGEKHVWRPVAVLDLKTKSAFDWWMREEKKHSRRHGTITVPDIRLVRRALTAEEWDEVVQQSPTEYGRKQLAAYASGVLTAYREATGDDKAVQPLTGTILVDTSQEVSSVKDDFDCLIDTVFDEYNERVNPQVGLKSAIGVEDTHGRTSRLVLILNRIQPDQVRSLKEESDYAAGPEAAPTITDESNLVLYLAGSSASRPGPSAAWIAAHCHGLEYLRTLCEEESRRKIVWIDVAGLFSSRNLARTRLRLSEATHEARSYFETATIIDASSAVHRFLHEGDRMPSLENLLGSESVGEHGLLVVSGWEVIGERTPRRLQTALRQLQEQLLDEMEAHGCLCVWFGSPRASRLTSRCYQRRNIEPYARDSFFNGKISRIVWNLPVRPYALGQRTPMVDDVRVIVEQDTSGSRVDLCEVLTLSGWSPRFWNRTEQNRDNSKRSNTGRIPLTSTEVLADPELCTSLKEEALDLIGQAPHQEASKPRGIPILRIQRYPVIPKTGAYLRSPILSLNPLRAGVRGSRACSASSLLFPRFTRRRRYRSRRLRSRERRRVFRPPLEALLTTDGATPVDIFRTEIDRIYDVMSLPSGGTTQGDTEWSQFTRSLREVVKRWKPRESTRSIADYLANHPESRNLWDSLSWERQHSLSRGMNQRGKVELREILAELPRVVLDTGNYLFLMLLRLTKELESLRHDNLVLLWDLLKGWQLSQLGFRYGPMVSDERVRISYDSGVVMSNLRKRALGLVRTGNPRVREIRYGKLLAIENEEVGYEYWMLLQESSKSSRLLKGLWRGASPLEQSERVRWSTGREDILASSAANAREASYGDFALIREEDSELLWVLEEDEWTLIGRAEIVLQRNSDRGMVRGVKVSPIRGASRGLGFLKPSSKTLAMEAVRAELVALQDSCSLARPVVCELTEEEGEYCVVTLRVTSTEGEATECFLFERVSDIIEFLRKGRSISARTEEPVTYTWNAYSDVDYGDFAELRPFVERGNPFARSGFDLPESFSGILCRSAQSVSLCVRHDPTLCPISLGLSTEHDTCWYLEANDRTSTGALTRLIGAGLTDTEIWDMMKTGVVYSRGKKHLLEFEFEPDPQSSQGIVFRESKRFAYFLGARPVPSGSFLVMRDEKLVCTLYEDVESLWMFAKSSLTGDIVLSIPLLRVERELEGSDILEAVEETLDHVIANLYEGDSIRDRIKDYHELENKLRAFITRRSAVSGNS